MRVIGIRVGSSRVFESRRRLAARNEQVQKTMQAHTCSNNTTAATRRTEETQVSDGQDKSLVERFTQTDLLALRSELLRSGVDSFQAAEIVCSFLSGRGYGISSLEARNVASKIEVPGVTAEHIQAELERVAQVM